MDIASIKQLIKDGHFPEARDQLVQILEQTPDDTVAQMLYGTCCQIMGDAETFGRIYQRLAPEMERCVKRGEKSERTNMWLKYAAMFAMLLMCGTQIWAQEDNSATLANEDAPAVAMSTKGDNAEFGRVMKMASHERMLYFLKRPEVNRELCVGDARACVIPLQSPRECKEQENLLLIRVKNSSKTGVEVAKCLVVHPKVVGNSRGNWEERGPETLVRFSSFEYATNPNPTDWAISDRIQRLKEDLAKDNKVRDYNQIGRISGAKRKILEIRRKEHDAKRKELELLLNGGEMIPRSSSFSEVSKDRSLESRALEVVFRTIEDHGDISDLIVSSEDPGWLILGICFVNVHGKMGGRAKYAGPRDYGDRFPRRVVTPQGKVIYELTEEMVRKEMEKERERWERPPSCAKYAGPRDAAF